VPQLAEQPAKQFTGRAIFWFNLIDAAILHKSKLFCIAFLFDHTPINYIPIGKIAICGKKNLLV